MDKIGYELPLELIAQHPLEKRDSCRLLRLQKGNGEFSEHLFSDILDLLRPDDLLVLNDTKVRNARLYGVGGHAGRKVEIFLVEKLSEEDWICLVRPGKKAKVGDKFYFSAREYAEIVSVLPDGSRRVKMHGGSADHIMQMFGHVPLPPYIKRDDTTLDKRMYQTVYAEGGFSIAAPTAGLHFTQELLDQIRSRGVEVAALRLDVGRGTFKPIDASEYERHEMDPEEYWISQEAAETIDKAKKEGRRVVAVGSTVTRALEGCQTANGKIVATHDETTLFIYPPYEFKVVDALITNFHLPESSLLAMVAAFAGVEAILNAYNFAVEKEYRFYSYGDAMLIE